VAGFSERSGRVISTCESGFREEDLGSGESLEDVHGPWQRGHRQVVGWFKDDAWVAGGDWWSRRRQKWQQVFSAAVGQPADIADAREASG
jgi:hypothetical protein